jgi:hypothetical protein
MSEEDDLLDEAHRSHPKLSAIRALWTETVDDINLQRLLQRMQNSFRARQEAHRTDNYLIKTEPRIIFGINDSPLLNAYAFKYDGFYIISFNVGSIAILADFFLRFLSNPTVLLNVGQSNREVDRGQNLPVQTDANVRLFRREGQSVRVDFCFPLDEERMMFALALSFLSLDFLVAHEIRHILAGHVDYLESVAGLTHIAEAGSFGSNRERLMIRQAIEMDADSFGACVTVQFALLGHEQQDAIESVFLPVVADLRSALNYACISIDMLFKIFSITIPQHGPSYWWMATHPPAHARRSIALGAASEFVRRRGWEHLYREFAEGHLFAEVFTLSEHLLQACFGHALAYRRFTPLGRKSEMTFRGLRTCHSATKRANESYRL